MEDSDSKVLSNRLLALMIMIGVGLTMFSTINRISATSDNVRLTAEVPKSTDNCHVLVARDQTSPTVIAGRMLNAGACEDAQIN